jgi:hypothetical protein
MTRFCERCGAPRRAWARRYCSRDCEVAARERDADERFWPRAQKTASCWLWQRGLRNGYGSFYLNGKSQLAHRVAYELAYGPIQDGQQVCHKCDVKRCVRPDHLFLGTALDNVRDRVKKARSASGDNHGSRRHPERMKRGLCHPFHKLTEDNVRQIRAEHNKGVSVPSLAQRFGITRGAIGHIVKRTNWKHVT